MNILFIDNFDSFTYNLVDEFEKRGCTVLIYRNNTNITVLDKVIKQFKPKLIVLSPGPSTPEKAGVCIELIREYHDKIPIFGVCLGHQCIIGALAGTVQKCEETIHGKASIIKHDGKGIFLGLPDSFQVGRYHSLECFKIPPEFEVSAKTRDKNIVMAVRHKEYPIIGVQFHPESILTPLGGKMIDNLLEALK